MMNKERTVQSPDPIKTIMRLFEKHYENLYCYMRRYTPPAECEELCQEVFLELADCTAVSDHPSMEMTLYRMARELLRRRYRPLLRIRHALDAFKSGTTWTQGRLMNMKQHPQPATTRHLRVLGRALTKLSSDQRRTLRLLITEGLSKEEASLRMGVTPGLVEAWASSGLERLNERMQNHVEQL